MKITDAQADPLIAERSLDYTSYMIWSNDSDFIFHNPNCVQIFDYKIVRGKLSNFVFATGSENTADLISSILSTRYGKYKDVEIFNPPKHKIWELEPDPLNWEVLACSIGNGYW